MISTIQSKLRKVALVQLEGRIDGGKNWTSPFKNYITTQKTSEDLLVVHSLKQETTKSCQPNQ